MGDQQQRCTDQDVQTWLIEISREDPALFEQLKLLAKARSRRHNESSESLTESG